MTTTRTTPGTIARRAAAVPALLLTVAFLLTGCGGSGEDDPGVASLDQPSGGAADDTSAGGSSTPADVEAELLAYVECLRGEGLDVPDPTVDAEGDLQMGGPGAGGGGPGGGGAGGGGAGGGGGGPAGDPEAFQAAMEVCGDVPEGAVGGPGEVDSAEFEDAALAFAECMREAGIDVGDPDLGGGGPGAGGGGGDGGPFGDLDMEDPAVQEALEACQQVFADAGMGQP
ncbi:hypothetical protein [Aquipuribacter sp. MA13-6]|uniref:hypothetical protein n=1 Tax=unclassified Aquipuribacter TaxID=2635084 RepID=UPI003EEBBC73